MDFKTVAITAAREAGEIIMAGVGNIREISLKKANDYLTNIDIESEEKIKAVIKQAFPDHGFVAEESAVETTQSEYIWYIDPVSSTKNFVHGLPHFATAIALEKNGECILSVVLDPFFNELFYVEKGKGAFLNDTPIHVSSLTDLSKAMLFVGIHTKGGVALEPAINYFSKVLPAIGDFRRFGSVALQICYVACGRVDGHIHNASDKFAIPAGKLMLEEAGGKVTDFQGLPWTTTAKTIVATNGNIHDALITILRE